MGDTYVVIGGIENNKAIKKVTIYNDYGFERTYPDLILKPLITFHPPPVYLTDKIEISHTDGSCSKLTKHFGTDRSLEKQIILIFSVPRKLVGWKI